MRLVLATKNRKKAEEILHIFAIPALEILTAVDRPDLPDVVEDGDTFEANAAKKALELAHVTGTLTMADDSGLEVDALDGAPGVYSARYAGEHGNDEANNRKLLEALRGTADRGAQFRCVIALAKPDGWVETVSGTCRGVIAEAPRGTNGFGYDPLFVPEGCEQTFAELDQSEKHRLSHRGRALQQAAAQWGPLFQGPA